MSLTEKPLVLELSTLGKKSSLRKCLSILNENGSYRSCFKEGADLMPRQAVIGDILGNKKAKVLSVQTSEVEKANFNVEKLRLLIKRQMCGHSCQGLEILSISKKSNRSKQKTVSFAIVLIDLARNLILT